MSGKYPSRWNNSSIYENLQDKKIELSLKLIEEGINFLHKNCKILTKKNPSIELAGELSRKRIEISEELWQLRVYSNCETSVNAKNEAALSLTHQCNQLFSRFSQALIPLERFLTLADEAWIDKYLSLEENKAEHGRIRFLRDKKDLLLDETSENLLRNFQTEGKGSWYQLYQTLSGTTVCEIESEGRTEKISMAKAAAELSSPDDSIRQRAYCAVKKAWETHEETSAIMLNSITGWRLKEDRLRAKDSGNDFLDFALDDGKLRRETLWAMMEAIDERGRSIGQRAALLQAKVLGKNKLEAWDKLAALPGNDSVNLSYDNCIDLIARSCERLGKEASDFVLMAAKQGWIDADDTQYRRTGGYCTGFAKDRTPRVFMTYQNQGKHAITLAHELGHAYHGWLLMKELSFDEKNYPMTLAETASTFFETLFKEDLESNSSIKGAAELAAWENLRSASTFLLDIPRRFRFEFEVFERIGQGERLSAKTLCDLVAMHSENYFGNSTASYDERLWQNKVHFYMPHVRFYNYPYTFGYLFSLAIYNHSRTAGSEFLNTYKNLLLDTGVKTCEEVADLHLNEDISNPDFWHKSIDIVEEQINRAELIFKERL